MTVKGQDYIRTCQYLTILKNSAAGFEFLYSDKNTVPKRIVDIRRKAKKADFKSFDIIILGFLPQLLIDIVRRKCPEAYIIADFFLSVWDTVCLDRKYIRKNA